MSVGALPAAAEDASAGPLLTLQTLVVEALRIADALGFDEGIALDTARLGIASRLRAAGMDSFVVDVPAPHF